MKKIYITILCGLFIALQVAFGRIMAIDVGFMRVTFVFIPIAIGGAILGPVWNGLICAAADIAGFLLVPSQGAFFPGFTLSAFLRGAAYGYFLKGALPFSAIVSPQAGPLSTNRSLLIRTTIAAFCVTILIDAFLSTWWVAILYEMPYSVYFTTRFIRSLALLPIHVVVFGAIWRSLGKYIENTIMKKINGSG